VAAPNILIVEDDETIGRSLQEALAAQGYRVRWVTTAGEGAVAVDQHRPDLMLVDLGLPDADGVDLCRRIRATQPTTTIVILTARSEEIDVVLGLDAGADDYVTKPFRLTELLARVRAHLRRPHGEPSDDRLVVGHLVLDPDARRAWLGEGELELRAKEFDLLALLMAEAGRAVTRERIMRDVWDEHWFGPTKTLDMHISALRRKLGGQNHALPTITTLRGIGYRLELP
jgi:DNA-binding response OmpR family regulator